MSALSDAVEANLKKPPMTLEQATALAKKRNPLLGYGLGQQALAGQVQRDLGPKATPGQIRMGVAGQENVGRNAARGLNSTLAKNTAPERDFLARAGDVFESPFSALGAIGADVQEGHWNTPYAQSATGHAMDLLTHGKFAEARQRYDPLDQSFEMVRRLAKDGNPVAQWALKHPTEAGIAGGGLEFLNPSNAVGGRAAEALGGIAKGGLTAAGRGAGAASKFVSADPAALKASPLYRLSQSLGEAATGARMGAVRQAARDQAPRIGLSPSVAADRADLAGRQMATSTETAKAHAQHVTRDVFGGLTHDQQLEVVDAIERAPNKLPPALTQKLAELKPAGSPAQRAMLGQWTVPDIQRRVQAYRTWRGATDAETLRHGLAEGSELWTGEHYFPRRGMTKDPGLEESEEQNDLQAEIEARRSRGGQNIRRDTLNTNIPARKYATRVEALEHGVTVDPEWNPADALYKHAVTRERNNVLEEGANRLRDLGLAEPFETVKTTPFAQPGISPAQKIIQKGKAAAEVTPHRKDYLPFTELGTVRQFGSPLFKGSAVHPAVADLVEDLASQQKTGGLASAADLPRGVLSGVNSGLARLEVSQPLYHVPVNVVPGAIARMATHGADVPALLKALVKPKAALATAQREGADYPYASSTFDPRDLQPFGSRTAKEKFQATLRDPGKIANALSTVPLYKHMQPYVAGATHAALRGRIGPEASALEVRSMLGEPENLGAREREIGQQFIFPSWQKAQARAAARLLARNPALYQAPHTAIEAHNRSRGVSPQPSDYGSLVPPIVTGVNKAGAVTEIPVPGPFNRAIGFADALGNLATGGGDRMAIARDVLNVMNPALGFGARALATGVAPAGTPSSLRVLDKDAPATEQRAQLFQSLLGRYAPVKGAPTTPGQVLESLLGVAPEKRLPPGASKLLYKIEGDVRGKPYLPTSVEGLRRLATDLRDQGDTAKAAKMNAYADKLYDLLYKGLNRATERIER